MTKEALENLQGGQRHEGSAGVLHLAGFRYWTASVLPAIVGTTLPFWLRPPGFAFRWLGAVEFLIATVLMHSGFSFLQARFERGATGKWSESMLLGAACACIAAACLLGLRLSRFTPGSIFIVYGLATLFAGLLYVAPPARFSQHAGGEIVVAMSLSLIPVLGAYLVQTGDLTRTVYLAALPIYAATGLWVWTERMASRSRDEDVGRETLVAVFGARFSGRVVVPVISVSLCATLLLAVLSASTMPWALTALLSLGLLWRIVSVSWNDYADTSKMLKVRTSAFIVHLVVCLVIAASSLAPVSCSAQTVSDTSEGSAHAALLDWAREHAIVLDTIEPGGSASDLAELRRLVGDARIVLLGDSRHDAREQWLLKHRLIEFLVEEMGFSVLAMEESLPCTSPLNACLLGERDDLDVALNEMGSWYIWDTDELLALMAALRAHNESVTSGPKARVYGFDISDGARPGVENALAFLGRVDEGLAERLEHAIDLTPFSEAFWSESLQNYGRLTPEAADSLGAGLTHLVGALSERRDDLVARSGEAEYAWALRQAVVARQAHDMMLAGRRGALEDVGNAREAAMADNLSWLLRVAAPGERVIVWAHNFHVARATQSLDLPGHAPLTMDPLGQLLAHEYGDSMISIGFSFDCSVDSSGLEPALEGWVDSVLGEVGPDAFLLDLRTAPQGGPVHEWLHAEQAMRGQGGMATLVPAEAFDALAFVREAGPTIRSARARARFASLRGE